MPSIIRYRSPFPAFQTLQDEMNQLLERFVGRETPGEPSKLFPATNVSETDDAIIVTCELPGIDPKSVDISVTGDLLTIKGEKQQEKEETGETWHRVERSYGSFSRSFSLPSSVVLDKVAADSRNGVLRITLPKSDESRRREIRVKVG